MTDDEFYRGLEELGVDEVERRLAAGSWAGKRKSKAELFVQRHKTKREADRHQDTIDRMDARIEIARKALMWSRIAIAISVFALILHAGSNWNAIKSFLGIAS
jgi:hypothetical protein